MCANNLNYVFQKNKFNCPRRDQCQKTNISSEQIQDDADYFINHLGVPTVRFTYEDIKTLEVSAYRNAKHTPYIAGMQDFILSWLFILLTK